MAERLAVFGGTFDPVHLAHLRAAEEAAEEVGLTQVLFMPAARPPHRYRVGARVEERLKMLRLATADNPLFGVSTLEAELGGTSYTVRTLEELHHQHPGAEIFFLIGADAFFFLHTWHEPQRLFELTNFVVMARPRSPHAALQEYMQNRLDPRFSLDDDGWVRLPGGNGAKRVPTTLLSVSSTAIRYRARAGRSIRYLVHPAVEDYIKHMDLYREPNRR